MRMPLTDDNGLFWGPEEAAFHACFIQDGFSTPEREAARMLLGGGTSARRARAWMTARDLVDEDLEWDAGLLAVYQARVAAMIPRAGDGPPDGSSPVTGFAWND